MVDKANMFWTDAQQARERIDHCVVLYEGLPYYVENIEDGGNFDDNVPRARIRLCKPNEKNTRKRLDSPAFGKFRAQPKLGWCNYPDGKAHFVSRIAVRSRQHGISNNNTRVSSFNSIGRSVEQGGTEHLCSGSNSLNLTAMLFHEPLFDMFVGNYPKLSDILTNIKCGTAIAYSQFFCVHRDVKGIRWLYRKEEQIGLFTGNNTLMLLEKFSFYREEIMEDEAFTVDNIQEY